MRMQESGVSWRVVHDDTRTENVYNLPRLVKDSRDVDRMHNLHLQSSINNYCRRL